MAGEITMLEAAKHSKDVWESAVAVTIVESTPILEKLQMKTINGPAYRYDRERSLGTVAFRGVNQTYTPDSGVINPEFESLVILGGEVKADNFEVAQMSNARDLKATKYKQKSRAMGLKFSEAFFEGDSSVDVYSFDGLRKRLTGNQLINAGAGGATLTLAMVDQLLDSVVGDNGQKALFMNKTLGRKITNLVSAVGGSVLISEERGNFGRKQMTYAGTPIYYIEREDDASTFLDFDENDGSGNLDTASIYCVRFGTDYVHGIQGMSLPNVKDFGEVEAGPYHLGRIEWYVGLVVKHARSAARLYHLNNA